MILLVALVMAWSIVKLRAVIGVGRAIGAASLIGAAYSAGRAPYAWTSDGFQSNAGFITGYTLAALIAALVVWGIYEGLSLKLRAKDQP